MSESFGRAQEKKGIKVTWRGIVLVIIAFFLAIFAVQNFQSADVNFLGLSLSVPVWLLVPGTFILGMFLGGVVRGTARKLRKPKPEIKK